MNTWTVSEPRTIEKIMKAATYSTYGSPDVIELVDVDTPTVGDSDVLVAVHASVVTQGDRRIRAADFPGISWLPGRLMFGLFAPKNRMLGTVFAGRVAAVGSAVTEYAVGDDVFGVGMSGAHAEFIMVPVDSPLGHMPRGMDYAEAAAIPYGAGTALTFIRDLGGVQPGQRVLIVGASGGVGRYAVQVAKHLGAEVTGVSSARSHDLVRRLGADQVIDSKEDFTTNGNRYDVIFDTSGAVDARRAWSSLTPKGRYLTVYMGVQVLLGMALTFFTGGKKAISGVAIGGPEQIEEIRQLVEQGAISPVIEATFPLDRIAQAHAHLETARPHGEVVVTIVTAASLRAVG
jgi:NADPH:quinone reductase-like Zn-dependent oxidoreductase